MTDFATLMAADAEGVVAPDGAEVRLLPGLPGGSAALFILRAGQTTKAVTHRTVGEVWHVVAGRGELWRRQGTREEIVTLEPGLTVTVPHGTAFQFRALEGTSLTVFGVTMPPWPGSDEALAVEGPWRSGS